jgi:hypothetical protein
MLQALSKNWGVVETIQMISWKPLFDYRTILYMLSKLHDFNSYVDVYNICINYFFYNNIYIYLITKVLIIQPDNSKKNQNVKMKKLGALVKEFVILSYFNIFLFSKVN